MQNSELQIRMTCEEHDEHAAATQFITHTTGRMLAQLNPVSTPIVRENTLRKHHHNDFSLGWIS